MKRTAVPILCALLLAACAGQPQGPRAPSPGASANLSGYPPEFREGYKDGCASVSGRRVRNDARFKSDLQYASGWRDGFDICTRQKR